MNISICTTSCTTHRGYTRTLNMTEVLKKLCVAGYERVDISFGAYRKEEYMLRGDDWEKKVEELGCAAEQMGIVLNQCHFPFTNLYEDAYHQNGHAEYFEEMLRRSYHAAAMLKIPHGVLHPQSFPQVNQERKACAERNHAFFDKYIELGMKLGVKSAMENMPPLLKKDSPMRYCMHYEDLIEFVDSYQEPDWVGICWDTGHANLMRFDQRRALQTVGSRLIALHVNDNSGQTKDEHQLPYLGNVDWRAVLQGLVDIDYQGDLTYETFNFSAGAEKGHIQDQLLRAMYENGMGLLELYREIKAASVK